MPLVAQPTWVGMEAQAGLLAVADGSWMGWFTAGPLGFEIP